MQSEASFPNVIYYLPAASSSSSSPPVERPSFKGAPKSASNPPKDNMYQIDHAGVASPCAAAHGPNSGKVHTTEAIASQYRHPSPYNTSTDASLSESQKRFKQRLNLSYLDLFSSESLEQRSTSRQSPHCPSMSRQEDRSHRPSSTTSSSSSSSSSSFTSDAAPDAVHVRDLSSFYASYSFSRANRRHIRAQQDREALWRRALLQATIVPKRR